MHTLSMDNVIPQDPGWVFRQQSLPQLLGENENQVIMQCFVHMTCVTTCH